ncbi:MAG: benzoate-CoA ligase family protein [Bacillota bacterium]|nr:benzoate-CoA ligase family protein [Bacillota bacterium]
MISISNIPDEFNMGAYLLDRHLDEGRGEKVAIFYKDKKITYREIAEAANRVGNALLELGVEQENRVMICLPDCPEFIFSYFGAMRIGAVPVPVSTMALAQDLRYYLNDSRSKVLITNSELAPKFNDVQQELKYLRHFIVLGPAEDGQISFEALMEKASTSLKIASTSKDDVAFWLYSSGTTGTPKGVVHLHHDLLYLVPPYKEALSLTEEDIIYSLSKMYFSYGNNNSLVVPFFCGAAVVLEPEMPTPEKLFEIITKNKPSVFYGVPTSYGGMLKHLEKTDTEYDLSSLRICMSSGEALPKATFDRWKEIFGIEIQNQLGSTDVGSAYISTTPARMKPGSIGILLSGFEGRLLDDHGSEVDQGETGTLWIKNDGITPYYWNKHEKSKESIHGEWFDTSDKFYEDEEGFYWFKGRKDDLIKAGGIWLSPLEVEAVLLEHPAVLECAVVGAPDKDNLEKPVAYAVLREEYNPSPQLERDLQEFVRSRLAHYKYPRQVHFVKELPRTSTGKIQRFKLRNI